MKLSSIKKSSVYSGSLGIPWSGSGGKLTELIFSLASSNKSSNLVSSLLENEKLGSKSLLKLWLRLISSSTIKPGVGLIISSISAVFSESANLIVDSKLV